MNKIIELALEKYGTLLFIKGKSFAEVGRNVGYSDNGLYNKVRRYIEKL